MSDDANFETFDPTAGEEGEALRARARAEFIRQRVHRFEDVCTRYVLTQLNALGYVKAIRRYNQDNLNESRLSVFAMNQTLPGLPVWFFPRQLHDLNRVRLADLFDDIKRISYIRGFLEGRENAPRQWRERIVMIFGPVARVRRGSRNLMVGYSQRTAPARLPDTITAEHTIHMPDEDLVFRPAIDYFRELTAEYQVN